MPDPHLNVVGDHLSASNSISGSRAEVRPGHGESELVAGLVVTQAARHPDTLPTRDLTWGHKLLIQDAVFKGSDCMTLILML